MGLGPAVAQVEAAELGQAERGPAEQGPAVAQVELGAVAELRPVEQWRSWSRPAVAQVGAAELGLAEQGPAVAQVGAAELGAVAELGQAGPEQGPRPVSESREGRLSSPESTANKFSASSAVTYKGNNIYYIDIMPCMQILCTHAYLFHILK